MVFSHYYTNEEKQWGVAKDKTSYNDSRPLCYPLAKPLNTEARSLRGGRGCRQSVLLMFPIGPNKDGNDDANKNDTP
jgi:hypothetical protein